MNNIIHLVNPDKNEKMYSPDSIAYQAIVLGLDMSKTLDKYDNVSSKHFTNMFGFHFGKACATYTCQYIETKFDNDQAINAYVMHFGNTIKNLSNVEFTCAISTLHDEVTNLTKHVGNKMYLTHLIITALNKCFSHAPNRQKMVANLFEVYSF